MKSPILFLIFNRPHTTYQVFKKIKEYKPEKLFIAADGPRDEKHNEKFLCEQSRKIIQEIDWKCEVFTLMRDRNLGCKNAVSSAITWFFSYVDEGIILEDDCVPDQSFFSFCEILLEKYRYDNRVMMISGTNYLFNNNADNNSYYFSKYYTIWGWATWRRAWDLYDINMEEWPEFKKERQLEWIYSDAKLIKWLEYMFDQAYFNKIDTWDIQWTYTCIFQNGLNIIPYNNLISNIGEFGHFTDGSDKYMKYIRMPVKSIDINSLVHPKYVIENAKYDRININHVMKHQKVSIRYVMMKYINRYVPKPLHKKIYYFGHLFLNLRQRCSINIHKEK